MKYCTAAPEVKSVFCAEEGWSLAASWEPALLCSSKICQPGPSSSQEACSRSMLHLRGVPTSFVLCCCELRAQLSSLTPVACPMSQELSTLLAQRSWQQRLLALLTYWYDFGLLVPHLLYPSLGNLVWEASANVRQEQTLDSILAKTRSQALSLREMGSVSDW